MNKQPVQLRKIRDFGQCISDAFSFLKEHFKPLVGITLSIAGIFLLLEMVSSYLYISTFFNTIYSKDDPLPDSTTPFAINYFINIAMSMLAYMVIVCSVNAYVAVYLENGSKKPTLAQVWGYLTYYFWRVLGGLSFSYFALIIGLILLVVPGIWLIPIISNIIPIIVIENISFKYAFGRSIKLVKNNWWFTFGVIFVSAIIAMVPGYFIGAVFGLIGGASAYFTTGKLGSGFGMGMSLVQVILQVLYIFPALASTFCYLSLVEEKEGPGMMDRIASFGEKKDDENGYTGDYEEQY